VRLTIWTCMRCVCTDCAPNRRVDQATTGVSAYEHFDNDEIVAATDAQPTLLGCTSTPRICVSEKHDGLLVRWMLALACEILLHSLINSSRSLPYACAKPCSMCIDECTSAASCRRRIRWRMLITRKCLLFVVQST
jgi:hypothetical protein